MIALALWIIGGAVVGLLVGRLTHAGAVDQVRKETGP